MIMLFIIIIIIDIIIINAIISVIFIIIITVIILNISYWNRNLPKNMKTDRSVHVPYATVQYKPD